MHPYMSVPFLVDLYEKVSKLVLSITYCPSIFILENKLMYREMWLWQL
jgi:hypothetical protein